MIESLQYIATFNTTGRTLKNHLKFKPGITVIKGENEAGKSFVFEMIRYALFGSAALRGDRSEYERLDVTLKIRIKGKLYTIVRKGNKATVNINEAVGTTATNKYILKELGFGLNVFDIAGIANQGELDKLTKDMGATERRKIIDEVTGLAQFEKAEKECREEANAFRRLAESLEAQLVEPVEPAKPDDYEESSVLRSRLDVELRNKTWRESLVEVPEPTEPDVPDGSRDAIEHEREREAFVRHRDSLVQALNKLPEIDSVYSRKELERFKAYLEQEARGPLPARHDPVLLEGWRADNIILARDSEPVRCPECGTVVAGQELPERPPLTNAEIDLELAAQRIWQGFAYDSSLLSSPLSRKAVEERLAAYDAQPERELLERQLTELGPEPEDRAQEADAWTAYDRAKEAYALARHEWGNYIQRKKTIDALPEPEPFLQEKYEMALRYETLLARYEASRDAYDTQVKQLEAAKAKRDGFKRGSDALKDARKEVKQYLVPSLSKVASGLLAEMTDGQRRHIFIDEDFNIWVDKQPVRTLSGSGVSVVNLALRIALGRVLTKSVIPFFLADEIDADMAAKRTKATYESLNRLRTQLTQILVITHKEYEGDYTVCLS